MATLFDQYSLKGSTLRNRIVASPMCQYMAREGEVNEWHRVHYSSLARGGAGLVFVEATAVSPEGRISWADLGLWNDMQAAALEPVVAEIVEHGAAPGIQLCHSGRKASVNLPWEGDNHIPLGEPNSWEIMAPSAIAFGANFQRVPHEMSVAEITQVEADTVCAAERARNLGFKWLELHFAHGLLAQSFFSPHSNHRTDQYGGSAENRARFLLETFRAVRKVWPEDRPLAVRFGVRDFDGNDETMLEESIALLRTMKAEGLDFVDVSVGFNTVDAAIPWAPHLLVDTAQSVLRQTGLPGTTSWYISDPRQADDLIRKGKLDLVTLGRPLLANPHWPYKAAQELGIESPAWMTLPAPYAHWLAKYH